MKKLIPSYVRVPLIFAFVFGALEYFIDSGDHPAFIKYPMVSVFLVVFLFLLVAIDIAVLVTVILYWRVRRSAGLLLVPYLAWVLFATVLNWQFLEANPDADGKPYQAQPVTRIQI